MEDLAKLCPVGRAAEVVNSPQQFLDTTGDHLVEGDDGLLASREEMVNIPGQRPVAPPERPGRAQPAPDFTSRLQGCLFPGSSAISSLPALIMGFQSAQPTQAL